MFFQKKQILQIESNIPYRDRLACYTQACTRKQDKQKETTIDLICHFSDLPHNVVKDILCDNMKRDPEGALLQRSVCTHTNPDILSSLTAHKTCFYCRYNRSCFANVSLVCKRESYPQQYTAVSASRFSGYFPGFYFGLLYSAKLIYLRLIFSLSTRQLRH